MNKSLFGGIFMGANLVLAAFLIMAASTTPNTNTEVKTSDAEVTKVTKGDNFDGAFIGEVRMFAGNFAPRGWAFCDGQLLPINTNATLFSILGTTYGGDGRNTFGLPDLRGRVAMHPGSGPGLQPYKLGQKGGDEKSYLTVQNLPSHGHDMPIVPIESLMNHGELVPTADKAESVVGTGFGVDHMSHTTNTGGGQPFSNIQPYQTMNYIICIEGLYPSRS